MIGSGVGEWGSKGIARELVCLCVCVRLRVFVCKHYFGACVCVEEGSTLDVSRQRNQSMREDTSARSDSSLGE